MLNPAEGTVQPVVLDSLQPPGSMCFPLRPCLCGAPPPGIRKMADLGQTTRIIGNGNRKSRVLALKKFLLRIAVHCVIQLISSPYGNSSIDAPGDFFFTVKKGNIHDLAVVHGAVGQAQRQCTPHPVAGCIEQDIPNAQA